MIPLILYLIGYSSDPCEEWCRSELERCYQQGSDSSWVALCQKKYERCKVGCDTGC